MTLFSNPLVLDLLAKYKPIAAMTHASSLLGWDLEINMPEAGAAARGQAQAEIELLRQKMTLGLAGLIEKAEKQKTLNDAEKGVIRVIKRELDFYQKIPADLLEQLHKKILAKTLAQGKFPEKHPLEEADYDVEALKQVNQKLTSMLDMPGKRFRQDVSTHPFSIRIAGDDVRITTRYEPKNFKASMFGLIHECGHALYELQVDDQLDFTPTGTGVSSGVHESQSRFWENIVGRSRQFTSMTYPLLKTKLSFLSHYDENQVYSYFNTVRPSLIRVEADELTYNFHIAMRYELEKKMLQGTVQVSELPSVWNDMIEEYLGKRPPDDAQGVLQDVHWSWGQYANFPGYSLGNVIAGMLWTTLTRKQLLPIKGDKSIPALKGWLAENVHKPGATYPPKELLNRVFGHGYDPAGLVSYLENKYLAAN